MKVPFIINNEGVTLLINGLPEKINKNHRKYLKVVDLLEEEADLEEIRAELSRSEEKVDVTAPIPEGLFGDRKVHPVLVKKYWELEQSGYPLQGLEEFFVNLDDNPSENSVESLFRFLEQNDLPITEDGCFVAYKGVQNDLWSVNGNVNTIVEEGEVDDTGRILNKVGSVIRVKRNQVDEDISRSCSHGLHVGSYSYAKNWGPALLTVKVNPRDVVSVPNDGNEKCRVCRYEVLNFTSSEITSPLTTEEGNSIDGEWDWFLRDVNDVLSKGKGRKYNFTGVAQELNLELGSGVKVHQLKAACDELGWAYDQNEDGSYYVVLDSWKEPNTQPAPQEQVLKLEEEEEKGLSDIERKNLVSYIDSELNLCRANVTNPTISTLWSGAAENVESDYPISFEDVSKVVVECGVPVVTEGGDSYARVLDPFDIEVWHSLGDEDVIKVSKIYDAVKERFPSVTEERIFAALDNLHVDYRLQPGGLWGPVLYLNEV